jgi:hypothetical protein
MSSSTPHPAKQIADANDRYFMLKNFILDYRKFIERTMVPIAENAISKADKAQTAVEEHLGRARNQKDTIEGAAILMSRRTAATELLSLFEEQMTSFENSEKSDLDKIYNSDDGYESLKTDTALTVVGIHAQNFVKQFCDYGTELHRFFERINKTEADKLKDNNEVWKKMVGTLESGTEAAWEFVELVNLWSKMNP